MLAAAYLRSEEEEGVVFKLLEVEIFNALLILSLAAALTMSKRTLFTSFAPVIE